MDQNSTTGLSPILFLPHGAGPLPLLGDEDHSEMIRFLKTITPDLGKPAGILIISAHWETSRATLTGAQNPTLLYDYHGFPETAYDIRYPAPGDPLLAEKVHQLLQDEGIEAAQDKNRGLDHGVFVPLKIMYPNARIPVVQLSLIDSLLPDAHLEMGKALSQLRKNKILIIGSGFSFHNLSAFFTPDRNENDAKNDAFQDWLIGTITNAALTIKERESRLRHWEEAPNARYCHPREEHLLPLHVCAGAAGTTAKLAFDGKVAGKRACAFLWQF